MKMLSFKLSNMSTLHSKYGYAENSEGTAKNLKIASQLADRIAEEDYTDEAFGNKKYLLEKQTFEFIPINEHSSKLVFRGLSEEEEKELHRLYRLEDELLERDIEQLFDMMKRDLRTWWD